MSDFWKNLLEAGKETAKQVGVRAVASGVDSVLKDGTKVSEEVTKRIRRARAKLRDFMDDDDEERDGR